MRDLTLEDLAAILKGLPLEYGDPLAVSYSDELNQKVPNTLQNFCLSKVLQLDNNMYQLALRALPFGFSEQLRGLMQKICGSFVPDTKRCWACIQNNGQRCAVCERTQKVLSIQRKHHKNIAHENKTESRKSGNEIERRKSANETDYSSTAKHSDLPAMSTENHFKLVMSGLEHPVENKHVQKLLSDILYGQFRNVSVHYVCIHPGNWERFREETFDKAYIVLRGPDSKVAGSHLIRVFKNPILKNIQIVAAKNQRLYHEEKTGGFCYRNSDESSSWRFFGSQH